MMNHNKRCIIPFMLLVWLVALSVLPHQVAAAVFINAGAKNEYIDSLGNTWEPDNYFVSGVAYRTKTAVPIKGTEDDELYLTGRYSDPTDPPMKYEIPLDEGDYKVVMHFTDTYAPTQEPGARVFDILMEGELAFEDVDIVEEAGGGDTALVKKATTSVSDGVLTIEFIHNTQNPAVSAIEIHAFEDLTPVFLNCGGKPFVDTFGNQWKSDTNYYNAGNVFAKNEPINGTDKEQLYQTQRFEKAQNAAMQYEIPLATGTYDVYFHFSETYWKINGPNQRVFNVLAEGSVIFEKLDVYADAGAHFKALVKKKTLNVVDGSLSISFGRDKQNPMISGIQVQAAVQASPPGVPQTAMPTMEPTTTMQPSSSMFPTSSGSVKSASVLFEPIRINAGGPNYTDTEGNEWVSDKVTEYFNTGLTFAKPATIEGTDDDKLFQSERWDVFNGPPMTYDVPVPDGIYDVTLYFAEIFSKAQAPNKRVFDVFVEDELIYEDFDIFEEAGGYRALAKETTAIVSDGALTIRFGHKIRDPKICAIEIRLAPPSSAPSMQPSTSASPTAPTFSPAPSDAPSFAPSMFPTETLLPWTDIDESEDYIARHECSFVQAGDKFYLFGGREQPRRLDIFDYTTNTWTQGAAAPKPFNHFQATVHEGLIWVIGAFETNSFPDEVPTNNVYVYDPAANVWMIGPSVTWPRGAGGLVVYKDQFYLLGGNSAGHDGGFVPWLDRYNPVTGQWKLLRDAPHARDHFHAVVLGDKLYATGGRRTIRGNTLGDTVKEVDVYDFETSEWLAEDSLPQDLPEPRASAATVAFDGKIVLMGGEAAQNKEAFSRVDALDPTTGRWSKLAPMIHKRHGMQAIVSGDGIFVAGGSPRRGGGQQKNLEVYNANEPEGSPSEGGILGLTFGGSNSVSIRHIGGNQGVFVNSIEVKGPSASDFVIQNKVQSRFLIPVDGVFEIDFEFKGTAADGASAMVEVTYTGSTVLSITLVATR